MDKRTFIKNISLLATVPAFSNLDKWIKKYEHINPGQLASDEDFWDGIRSGYRLKPDYINLENGYYCFLPQETLENFIGHVREINYQGSYYMRTKRFEDNDAMAAKLATLAGCSNEELIITRNATESLDLIIGGTHWQPGDEAVMAEQDYGSMLDMFKLVAKRHGVINKIISVPNHPTSDEEIVNLYANAITAKTKLLMVCHMINITGQILPVQKICDMAHSKGVKVMVDGAHAFAHFNFSIPDLHCDYYGTSLHKWLSVPLGLGFLYVKKENIADVWPLLGENADLKDNDIHRLNHVGTPPVHTYLAVANAIDYYLKIGADRKEERLRFLQHYWTSKVRNLPNVVVNTPADKERSCGIANVGIKGMKPADLADTLLKKYKIYTVAIDYANVQGCRIAPNIYTTPKELDQLVIALKELSKV
ncbi:MAG: aminotransferase class V-fold PLP-dependent enzyme [Chitinophagales bacterium]